MPLRRATTSVPRQQALLGRLGLLLSLAWLLSACTTRTLPVDARVIARVDWVGSEKVDADDIAKRIATSETVHALGGLLRGTPILTLFDAMTVEYHTYDRLVLERDLQRIRRYYRARGFYDAQVRAGRVLVTEGRHVRIEIVIVEGEPVLVEQVQLEFPGWDQALDANAAMHALVDDYGRGPREDGEPLPRFDEERYDDLRDELLRALTDRGFAYAELVGKVEVDVGSRHARVLFQVEAGPPCVFGPVRFEGLGEIPEGPVRRALGIEEGDTYSTAKIDAAQLALADFQVFGSVEITAVRTAAGSEPTEKEPTGPEPTGEKSAAAKRNTVLPLIISVQPIKLRAVKVGIGAEIGSRVETHAILGWEDRNFLGGLRRFTVDTRPGLVFFPLRAEKLFSPPDDLLVVPEAALELHFVQPAFPEARTNTVVSSGTRIYQPRSIPVPDDFDSTRDNVVGYRELDGSFGFERKFRFDFAGGSILYLGQFIKLRFDDPFSYNLSDPPEGFESVLVPYLETVASWDFRKGSDGKPSATEPHSGVWFGLNLQFAGGFLQGDADDIRLQPEVRAYAPVSDEVTVAVRWMTGFLFPRNYGDTLVVSQPPDEGAQARDLQLVGFRGFFSGGPSSNRGYGYREVGPHKALSFLSPFGQPNELLPTGGLGLWELSGELRVPFGEKFVGVLFVDASDVVPALSQFRIGYPHISPGLGLRMRLPIGRLRFDWGFRPPYLQKLGEAYLEPEEGGPKEGDIDSAPFAFALAIGEAF